MKMATQPAVAEIKSDPRRHDHRSDLTPCVNAPPIPAQHVHRTGSGAQAEHNQPALAHRMEHTGDPAAEQYHHNREQPPDSYIVLLRFALDHKPAVKIIHQI